MKEPLVKVVKDFFFSLKSLEGPILLGISGGEDSSALFTLLLECRSFFSFDLQCVHFDHKWRKESGEEAVKLKSWIENFGVPCILGEAKASPKETGNLEEKARLDRFAFFKKVYKDLGAKALLLAHQREDQAETVLKRLFEGSGLLSLEGMQKVSSYEDMVIGRPLLDVPRIAIEHWNLKQKWVPFQDYTNKDSKFLRPRIRQELFPLLEKHFGKQIKNSLCRVSQEIGLFKQEVQEKSEDFLKKTIKGALGSVLYLDQWEELSLFLKQEIVRLFIKKHQATISRDSLEKVVALLEKESSNKQVDISQGKLLLEKKMLVWMPDFFDPFLGSISLEDQEGVSKGSFLWSVQKISKPDEEKDLLSCFLKGRVSYVVKKGEKLSLSSFDLLSEKDQKKVSSFFAKNKVPSKMRKMFPFVTKSGQLIDFSFSFDSSLNNDECVDFFNVVLKKIEN